MKNKIIEEPVLEDPKTEIFAKPVVVELFDNQTNDIQKILLEEDGEDEDNLSLYDRLKENKVFVTPLPRLATSEKSSSGLRK